MKRTLLLCASLLALQVQAQPAPAAASAAPAAKPKLEVNPFTGKPLSVEQIQRELEEAKLRTAVLEEALKQSNLQEELQALPARKSVEMAQARTAVKREEVAMSDLEGQRRSAEATRQAAERAAIAQAQREEDATRQARKEAADRAAAAKRDAARKAKEERDAARKAKLEPKSESSSRGAENASAPAKPLPKVALTSVLSFGSKHSAVLDVNGEAVVVEDGGMTNFGPLRVLGRDSVELNGVQLNVVSSGVSRFTVSDPKPVDPKAAAMETRTVSLPNSNPMPTVSQLSSASNVAPSAPSGSSLGAPRATLPPLQLPPGLTVLPNSAR